MMTEIGYNSLTGVVCNCMSVCACALVHAAGYYSRAS
jgi:hypothetical protein